MAKKKNFYNIIIILLCILAIPTSAFCKKSTKPSSLKLIVKSDSSVITPSKEVIKKLNELSKDLEETAKLYNTLDQKTYWENEAKKSYLKLLQAEGYYNASIETELPENKNVILFYVTGGERAKITKIRFKYAKNSNRNINIPDFKKLKIKEGDFIVAENIINAQKHLLKETEKINCLLHLDVSHKAILDRAYDSVEINFIINAGPEANIQSINVSGLKSLNPEYVKKLVPLKNGQCFKRSVISEAQLALQQSGLFAITNIEIPDKPDEKGEIPITLNLLERKHRSIKAGISYETGLGLGITTGWNHRNFLGNGEAVKTELSFNPKEQSLDLTFTKPFYKQKNQTLKIGVSAESIISKAFTSKEGAISGGVERIYNQIWTAGGAGKYSYAYIKIDNKNQDFSFLSLPIFIKRDTRNNILNPSKGTEIRLEAEPFYSLTKSGTSFNKSKISASKYYPFKLERQAVFAAKVSVGSINGIKLKDIPANEKFYIGGPQSVRGYAYQLAGPIEANKRPRGGRSVIETSLELRMKIKSHIGFVTFLDIANISDSVTPAFKKKTFRGAGFGVRYFTDFGPLRLDIGFPLKKRGKLDKAFQVYFGIGQSF